MADVYIGLGSNLESPPQQIHKAVTAIEQIPDTRFDRLSSLYRSKPVGPKDQPDYINAVAHIITTLPPGILLGKLQEIEDQQGRTRDERWGARTLDLDILLYDDQVINEKNLVIPHPEMHKRIFVLYPLYEIAPDIEIPETGPIKQLLDRVDMNGLQKLDQI